MFSLVIQTLLLVAIAFILGVVLGALLRNLFGSAETETSATDDATGAAAALTTSAEVKSAPTPVKAMEIPKPPKPTAPEQPAEKAKVVVTPPAPPKAPAQAKAAGRVKVVRTTTTKPKVKKAAAKTKAKGAKASPKVEKTATKPKAKTAKASPKVEKAAAKPKVKTTKASPKVEKTAAKPKVKTAKASPKVKKAVSKPTAKTAKANPNVKTVAAKPKSKPKSSASKTPDNLKLIRGIGPKNEGRLNALGVNQFAQIASWKKKDVQHYGEVLNFPDRIQREEWVKQAKVLAKGGATKFSKRVTSGKVGSSLGKTKAVDMGKKPTGLRTTARRGNPDKLTAIDGVGPAIEKKLNKIGVYHFDQISKMTKPQLAWLGNAVGFPGRPERENWVKDAKALASGKPVKAAASKRGAIKPKAKK